MGYKERLKTEITLTSPDGNIFTALWRGNERSQTKKVGVFNYPGVNGSGIQDLGTTSKTYPLTLFFEGDDHDINSNEFMEALSEKGTWVVVHPVHGELTLQPLSFTPQDQPITSGNITQVDTEWIEPLIEDAFFATIQILSEILALINKQNEASAEQYNQYSLQDTAAEKASIKNSINKIVSAFELNIETISNNVAEVKSSIDSIKRDINVVLEEPVLDLLSLAGQIQQLIQLPVTASQDLLSTLTAYENIISQISIELVPENSTTEELDRAMNQELALTAALGAFAVASSRGALLSRAEAIEVINKNLTVFDTITTTLDNGQETFQNNFIDKQYFSQSLSYTIASQLIGKTVAYLLRKLFDLKIEKTFILKRQRNPVMVTIEEYGGLGENDSNLDLFIDSNKLEDNELLIMPKGKELKVYV
jgi:prophage DNA circulation protein